MPRIRRRRAGPLAAALLVAGALGAASGCTITRVYVGVPVELEAVSLLVPGRTSKGEVLRTLGAPDGIVRQFDGDIFVYRYLRRNTATFQLEEPVITNLEIFSYTRSHQRHDSIVVLFDEQGTVREVGVAEGTEGLGAF